MESIPRDRVTLDTRARFVSCILKTFLCLVLLEMLKYSIPFHKVDDDWCLDREEESRSRLEERGGALDGYIKGWNRWTSNVIIIDTRPMP